MINKNFPLRLFFFLGWMSALIGSGFWIFSSSLPILEHSRILTGGFLFGYSTGFLLTAVPVFLDSDRPNRMLVGIAASFLMASTVAASYSAMTFFHVFFLAAILVIILTLALCFRTRKNQLPPFFAFVALGFLSAIVSNFIFAFSINSYSLPALARVLLFEGIILSFVVGIGSRILPVIFGYRDSVLRSKTSQQPKLDWHIISGVTLFAVSFLIEVYLSVFVGRLLRAILLISLAFGPLKLYRLPRSKGVVPVFVWVAMWSLVIGQFGNALSNQSIAWLHLTFIAGFSLMTLMIALHVLVEREQLEPRLEKSSNMIFISAILLFGAAIVRFFGTATGNLQISYLRIAALLWIGSFCLWLVALAFNRSRSAE